MLDEVPGVCWVVAVRALVTITVLNTLATAADMREELGKEGLEVPLLGVPTDTKGGTLDGVYFLNDLALQVVALLLLLLLLGDVWLLDVE